MSDEHLPVNIGNPQEITILEFAERIRNILKMRRPSFLSRCRRTIPNAGARTLPRRSAFLSGSPRWDWKKD